MGLDGMVLLRLVVHPVDTAVHATVPAGWRWAVMAGEGPDDDMARCANAGWAPERAQAEVDGETVAVAAVKACRLFGLSVRYEVVRLDYDPIPAGADRLNL